MKDLLKTHEIECDKCAGTGINYGQSIAELLRHWRKSLGITQRQLTIVSKISYTEICKFEKGSLDFGQKRIRKIIEILENWNETQNF